jgi:hypothetical protein
VQASRNLQVVSRKVSVRKASSSPQELTPRRSVDAWGRDISGGADARKPLAWGEKLEPVTL